MEDAGLIEVAEPGRDWLVGLLHSLPTMPCWSLASPISDSKII